MQRRKKIVVGNWKMNPNALVDAKSIFSKIKRVALRAKKTQTVICPPFVHVAPLVSLAGKSSIAVGVQDVFWEDQGSFTGSISASQAKGVGAQYAIVGHSERRKQGEDNEQVAREVARELGIDAYFAQVLPENKYKYIKELQEKGMLEDCSTSKSFTTKIDFTDPDFEKRRKDMCLERNKKTIEEYSQPKDAVPEGLSLRRSDDREYQLCLLGEGLNISQ